MNIARLLGLFLVLLCAIAVGKRLVQLKQRAEFKALIQAGNITGVDKLLARNHTLISADLGGHRGDRLTALSIAAGLCQPGMCSNLIQNGADVNYLDRLHNTPLHSAIECGNLKVVEMLLDNGADPKIPNAAGITALALGEQIRSKEIAMSKSERTLQKFVFEAVMAAARAGLGPLSHPCRIARRSKSRLTGSSKQC